MPVALCDCWVLRSQGNDEERAAEERAEELLARLELQDAAPPPLPRSPPADVSALGVLQVCTSGVLVMML
jgi:hypothetical protein